MQTRAVPPRPEVRPPGPRSATDPAGRHFSGGLSEALCLKPVAGQLDTCSSRKAEKDSQDSASARDW
jgi:hypothetical protein